MRKLLLATTAALAASLGGAGIAQAQISTIPTLIPGTSPFGYGGTTPTPGTVVVRLGGKVVSFAGYAATSGDKITVPAGTGTNAAASAAGTTAIPAGTYKQSNVGLFNDLYLYPSVDGVAANGLQYGAFIELRAENFNEPGGSNQVTFGGGTSPSAASRSAYIYARRMYAYLGAPGFGTVRFGSTDGPTGLFETGTFENFDTGGWNGNEPSAITGNTTPDFPFAGGNGWEYATNKIVYLSPQLFGFDFGASFEPTTAAEEGYNGGTTIGLNSTATGLTGSGGCNYAEPGCVLLSSGPVGLAGRRKNTASFDSRYRGTFGPVGVALEAGWMGSQHEGTTSSTGGVRYNGFDLAQVGATASFAGLTVGGHLMYGDYNKGDALKPVGAVPAATWIGGVSYASGPMIVGTSYYVENSAGNSGPLGTAATTVGQYRARGFAAGGTYSLAPGVAVFASYLFGDQKENGVNLLGDGETTPGAPTHPPHDTTRASGVYLGTFVRW